MNTYTEEDERRAKAVTDARNERSHTKLNEYNDWKAKCEAASRKASKKNHETV